jgi:hypothetical protein
VDLVLQQENHLQHLHQVQSMHNAATQKLELLLQGIANGTAAQQPAAAAAAEGRVWSAGTSSGATSSTAAGSSDAGGTGVARMQQQQRQRQQQQQGRAAVDDECDLVLPELEDMLVDLAAEPFTQQQQQQSKLAFQQQQQQQLGGTDMYRQTPDSSDDQAEWPAAAVDTAATAAGMAKDSAPGHQYVHSLMMGASKEQWERSLSWSVQDWWDYYSNLVMRLCLLMELLGRLEGSSSTAAGGSAGTPTAGDSARAAAAAAAAAKPAVSGSGSDGSGYTQGSLSSHRQQQQQQHWIDEEELDDAEAMQFEQQQAAAEQETLQEIDAAVDDFVTMINLCVLFNPMPVREVTRHNLVTGECVDCVPSAHWQQVRR